MKRNELRPSREAPHWPKVWYRDVAYVASISLGNMTRFDVVLAPVDAYQAFVAVAGHGAELLPTNYCLDGDYVASKLRVMPGDGANRADFLNVQFGLASRVQGRYHDDLTVEGVAEKAATPSVGRCFVCGDPGYHRACEAEAKAQARDDERNTK